jgi:hypothetical protein
VRARLAITLGVLLLCGGTAAAQTRRRWIAIAPGSLSPDDPFTATLSFRGTLGWIASDRTAFSFDYTRQSANRSEGSDLGKYARNYFGVSWQHGSAQAFADDDLMKQQYLFRVGVGLLTRGTFRGVSPAEHLKTAGFVDVGAEIRYPFTQRLAAVGTLDDVLAFLPHQVVTSGSQTYVFGGDVQHNFGLFIALQWRV